MKLRRRTCVQEIRNAGFTLMEMMLVVTIIALLSGLAIYKLKGAITTAEIVAARGDMSAFQSALGAYRTLAGSYPSTAQGLQALVTKPDGEPQPAIWRPQFPDGLKKDPWKHDYVYKCPGVKPGHPFDVYSVGEDGIEGNDDDIRPQ
jgi:general secretion pathway protein G